MPAKRQNSQSSQLTDFNYQSNIQNKQASNKAHKQINKQQASTQESK